MPEPVEQVDALLGDALEIEVDPGMSAARAAAPESDERQLLPDQVVDARVGAVGLRDDQAVHHAPLDDALHMRLRILVGPAIVDDEIEPMGGENRLQSIEDGHEEGFALGGAIPVRDHHEADHACCAAAKATARLVRRITVPLRGLEHALTRLRAHAGPIIEGTRDGANGDVQAPRNVVNVQEADPVPNGLHPGILAHPDAIDKPAKINDAP